MSEKQLTTQEKADMITPISKHNYAEFTEVSDLIPESKTVQPGDSLGKMGEVLVWNMCVYEMTLNLNKLLRKKLSEQEQLKEDNHVKK